MIAALALAAASPRVAAEGPPAAAHAALADGEGLVVEVGAASSDLGGPPAPAVPLGARVGLGALLEPADGAVVGAFVHGGPWARDGGVGYAAGGGVSAALGSPMRTSWIGGDAGVTVSDGGLAVPFAVVGAIDVDPSTTLSVRGGGSFDVTDGELESRAGLGATYRFSDRDGFTVAAMVGFEPDPVPTDAWAFAASAVFHHRFGPVREGWVMADAPRGVAAAAPVAAVDPHPHPELDCAPGDVPTGRPPPIGLEGWCVRVARNGEITRQGPFVRWHDMETVAEKGYYTDGTRSGTWSRYDHEGVLREQGDFANDRETGRWTRWYPGGSVEDEGEMLDGEPVGEWRIYAVEGWLQTVGSYVDGLRDGRWVDYDAAGVEIRERLYAEGRMTSTQDLVAP